MSTQLSTKLTAAALALMINSFMIGGVAYLFSAKVNLPSAATALAQARVQSAGRAAV
jgi:hypothetical protein